MTISGAVYREGVAYSPDGAMYVTQASGSSIANPTFTGTVTASQVSGIEIVLAKWGVPVILASSGSMANNGAISAMTALPATYSGGAWLYLPANAIQAGSAAGFYWFVASSTTAGTVYNSTWDGSGIPAVGTTTAFVSTGPGAFTGIAAGEFTAATVTVPAGALGPNGSIRADLQVSFNTAAGNKIFRARYSGGAGTGIGITASTAAVTQGSVVLRNQGVANRQVGSCSFSGAGGLLASAESFMSVDTTASTTIVLTLEKATATNHAIWHGGTVLLAYGA